MIAAVQSVLSVILLSCTSSTVGLMLVVVPLTVKSPVIARLLALKVSTVSLACFQIHGIGFLMGLLVGQSINQRLLLYMVHVDQK